MDNQILTAQEEHEQDAHTPTDSGQPPVVIQNTQEGSGGGGNSTGVLAIVALVALVVLGIWWFGFGPGAGEPAPATAPPAQSSAPVQSTAPTTAP
jgi:hypothetical protein